MDEDVRQALDALPPAFREAVWMRDVDELSYQDIATALDVPIGTVMSRISRGRRLLLQQLRERREQGECALERCARVKRVSSRGL